MAKAASNGTAPKTTRARRTAQAPRSAQVPPVAFVSPDDARRARAATGNSKSNSNSGPNRQLRQLAAAGEGAQFIAAMDDDFLACRGDRHSFPKLKLKAGKLSKGIRIQRQPQGVFQLTFICPDCGTERTRTTLRGGVYDPGASYTYRYPAGYLSPKDSGLRRGDFAEELQNRIIEGGVFDG